MTVRRASCSCGQLVVTCSGEPVRVSMCHCLACQRRTGSAFGIQARFARDQVSMEGRASQYARTGDSGGHITLAFCPICGSTVYWEIDTIPGFVAVAVGAFADREFPPPQVSVYDERRYPWAVMPELDIEHLE